MENPNLNESKNEEEATLSEELQGLADMPSFEERMAIFDKKNAPEGVRDAQDYKEYLEEMKAKEEEKANRDRIFAEEIDKIQDRDKRDIIVASLPVIQRFVPEHLRDKIVAETIDFGQEERTEGSFGEFWYKTTEKYFDSDDGRDFMKSLDQIRRLEEGKKIDDEKKLEEEEHSLGSRNLNFSLNKRRYGRSVFERNFRIDSDVLQERPEHDKLVVLKMVREIINDPNLEGEKDHLVIEKARCEARFLKDFYEGEGFSQQMEYYSRRIAQEAEDVLKNKGEKDYRDLTIDLSRTGILGLTWLEDTADRFEENEFFYEVYSNSLKDGEKIMEEMRG